MQDPEASDSSGASSDSEQSRQWAASHGQGGASSKETDKAGQSPGDGGVLRPALELNTTLSDDGTNPEASAADSPASTTGGAVILPALKVNNLPRVPTARLDSSSATEHRVSRGIRLKCKYGNDIRVVALAIDVTFQSLYARLAHDFGFDLALKYEDKDGDLIVLSSENDLQELLDHERGTIAVFVYPLDKSSATGASVRIPPAVSMQSGFPPSLRPRQPPTAIVPGATRPGRERHNALLPIGSPYEVSQLLGSHAIRWQRGLQLGKGAFGTVYQGLNQDTGELMAVKQIDKSEMSAKELADLEGEVKMLDGFSHENIVRYLGTSRTEQMLVIFLEYVPGGSIRQLLERFGPFEESIIRVYTRQILLGLEYLHRNGVAHRDIKGANILVTNDGIIKLADFGSSARTSANPSIRSGSGTMPGTPLWMAPEVIKDQKCARGGWKKADIWSVGCTVIEMATGRPPWSQFENPVIAMYQIACEDSSPDLPECLSDMARDFLSSCFVRDPAKRPDVSSLLLHPFVALLPATHLRHLPGTMRPCTAGFDADAGATRMGRASRLRLERPSPCNTPLGMITPGSTPDLIGLGPSAVSVTGASGVSSASMSSPTTSKSRLPDIGGLLSIDVQGQSEGGGHADNPGPPALTLSISASGAALDKAVEHMSVLSARSQLSAISDDHSDSEPSTAGAGMKGGALVKGALLPSPVSTPGSLLPFVAGATSVGGGNSTHSRFLVGVLADELFMSSAAVTASSQPHLVSRGKPPLSPRHDGPTFAAHQSLTLGGVDFGSGGGSHLHVPASPIVGGPRVGSVDTVAPLASVSVGQSSEELILGLESPVRPHGRPSPRAALRNAAGCRPLVGDYAAPFDALDAIRSGDHSCGSSCGSPLESGDSQEVLPMPTVVRGASHARSLSQTHVATAARQSATAALMRGEENSVSRSPSAMSCHALLSEGSEGGGGGGGGKGDSHVFALVPGMSRIPRPREKAKHRERMESHRPPPMMLHYSSAEESDAGSPQHTGYDVQQQQRRQQKLHARQLPVAMTSAAPSAMLALPAAVHGSKRALSAAPTVSAGHACSHSAGGGGGDSSHTRTHAASASLSAMPAIVSAGDSGTVAAAFGDDSNPGSGSGAVAVVSGRQRSGSRSSKLSVEADRRSSLVRPKITAVSPHAVHSGGAESHGPATDGALTANARVRKASISSGLRSSRSGHKAGVADKRPESGRKRDELEG